MKVHFSVIHKSDSSSVLRRLSSWYRTP